MGISVHNYIEIYSKLYGLAYSLFDEYIIIFNVFLFTGKHAVGKKTFVTIYSCCVGAITREIKSKF
jgi:hypothetical protein